MSSWLPGEQPETRHMKKKTKRINNVSVLPVEEIKGESYVHLDTLPTDQKLFPSGISFYDFFLMWTIFKVFVEFVTILFLFYGLVFWP